MKAAFGVKVLKFCMAASGCLSCFSSIFKLSQNKSLLSYFLCVSSNIQLNSFWLKLVNLTQYSGMAIYVN